MNQWSGEQSGGNKYGTESQEWNKGNSAEVGEADTELSGRRKRCRLRSHWRTCVGDAERPSADAER